MKTTLLLRNAAAFTILAAVAGFPAMASAEAIPEIGSPTVASAAPAWYTADDSYGSQGFHHGLPMALDVSASEPVTDDVMDAAMLPALPGAE